MKSFAFIGILVVIMFMGAGVYWASTNLGFKKKDKEEENEDR